MSRRRVIAGLSVVVLALFLTATTDAWARARSGGTRGSRTYSAPARPAPASPDMPASPSRAQTPSPSPQRPGLFGGLGGFGGILGGLLLGGLLGGLLFGAHGFGIGLLDILLVGGGLFLLVSLLRRRQAREPAYAMAGQPAMAGPSSAQTGWTRPVTVEAPPDSSDVGRGVNHIRTLDPAFDPAALTTLAGRIFVRVQESVMARDVTPLRDYLAPEMLTVLQAQCDQLRSSRQTNRIERIEVRSTEVTEAWQESGRDYATVRIQASLLDYTMNDGTGAVIEGSRTQPQGIEEFWTFTRPVGPQPWRLGAIQTG
ncbi:MAG: Tim44 domain-containing protein [Candidatus Rokuibacteriota bacterium]